MSLAPCASELDSCTTRGRKVVANRALVGVGWIMRGLLRSGMRVLEHIHHSTKGVPWQVGNR